MVEVTDRNQQPQPFAGLGKWIRHICEEVEASEPDSAFALAEKQLAEREGVSDCRAVGFTEKPEKELRMWRPST